MTRPPALRIKRNVAATVPPRWATMLGGAFVAPQEIIRHTESLPALTVAALLIKYPLHARTRDRLAKSPAISDRNSDIAHNVTLATL